MDTLFVYGGNNRARTCDPLLVRQMLSQLSYAPSKHKRYYNISKNINQVFIEYFLKKFTACEKTKAPHENCSAFCFVQNMIFTGLREWVCRVSLHLLCRMCVGQEFLHNVLMCLRHL